MNRSLSEYRGQQEPDWGNLRKSLFHYCLMLTGSEWEAGDLTQTALSKGMEKLRKGHDNPEAFLFRTAKNSWIDQCRRQSAYRELLEGMLRTPQNRSGSEEAAYDAEEMMLAVAQQLPPIQAVVFVLREALGFSIAETASMLETSEGAVKAALHRARQSLGKVRSQLEREEQRVMEERMDWRDNAEQVERRENAEQVERRENAEWVVRRENAEWVDRQEKGEQEKVKRAVQREREEQVDRRENAEWVVRREMAEQEESERELARALAHALQQGQADVLINLLYAPYRPRTIQVRGSMNNHMNFVTHHSPHSMLMSA